MNRNKRGYRLAGVLLVVLALVGMVSCSQDPETKKQKHLARGEKYLAEQKLDEAILEFRNALQVDPKFVEAHAQIGRAYQRKGWAIDARWEFQRAVELKPDHVGAQLDLASASLDLGALQDAEKAAG